jgi:hypothetical protein
MKQGMFDLLGLQDVDNEIDALRKNKSAYPVRSAELQARIVELRDDRAAKEAMLKKHETGFSHFVQQLAATEENLKKHQTRLLEIKTNREYDAVQQEIMGLEQAVEEYFAEREKEDEEVRKLRNLIDEAQEAFDKETTDLEAEVSDLDAKARAIDGEVAQVMEKRKAVAGTVPPRVLSVYERVRHGKKNAVVRVSRGACGGCWRSLPPQRLNELRMFSRIIVCDGCGRILVWDDRESAA